MLPVQLGFFGILGFAWVYDWPMGSCSLVLDMHVWCVRFCSCVVYVSFMFCLCSVAIYSWLHRFALVVVDCSRDALQPIAVHYEIVVYSGICASICPLVVMYVELLASRLA